MERVCRKLKLPSLLVNLMFLQLSLRVFVRWQQFLEHFTWSHLFTHCSSLLDHSKSTSFGPLPWLLTLPLCPSLLVWGPRQDIASFDQSPKSLSNSSEGSPKSSIKQVRERLGIDGSLLKDFLVTLVLWPRWEWKDVVKIVSQYMCKHVTFRLTSCENMTVCPLKQWCCFSAWPCSWTPPQKPT